MPSAGKQKAKKKCSTQAYVMSDLENVDIMLKRYSRNEVRNECDVDFDLESNRNTAKYKSSR